jgi:hypothetical protein
VGLTNTRERLEVLYGEHSRFAVLNGHPGVRVELGLPLELSLEPEPQTPAQQVTVLS